MCAPGQVPPLGLGPPFTDSWIRHWLQALSIVVSENIERREAVETGLVAIEQSCSDLQDKQKKMSSAIELQAQYSRKNTLLLAGKAIPGFQDGENTRMTVVSLLKEYLGLDIHPRAITACHRLRNKSIILVRFADLDERMTVYSQRLSPKKRGLLIHESLTNERLAVIHTLQKLHKSRETSPFLSYYTSMGRIFIRLADPTGRKAAKTVELAVGVTEQGILEICEHHKVKKKLYLPSRPPPRAMKKVRNQTWVVLGVSTFSHRGRYRPGFRTLLPKLPTLILNPNLHLCRHQCHLQLLSLHLCHQRWISHRINLRQRWGVLVLIVPQEEIIPIYPPHVSFPQALHQCLLVLMSYIAVSPPRHLHGLMTLIMSYVGLLLPKNQAILKSNWILLKSLFLTLISCLFI